ncbi:MAG: hypothetical protein V4450_07200 [Bacteroidota bacterium]
MTPDEMQKRNADMHDAMIKAQRDEQSKFAYYLIALSVTAIGFSVFQTMGKGISLNQIPLACAIVCWGLSIHFGFGYLDELNAFMLLNIEYLRILLGVSDYIGGRELSLRAASELLQEKRTGLHDHANKQRYSFYAGVLFFIVWHVVEMIHTSQTQIIAK